MSKSRSWFGRSRAIALQLVDHIKPTIRAKFTRYVGVALVAVLIGSYLFPKPDTLTTFNGQSEFISVLLTDPESSILKIEKVRLGGVNGRCLTQVEVELPAEMTSRKDSPKYEYDRSPENPNTLSIAIPVGAVIRAKELTENLQLAADETLILTSADGECRYQKPFRLPVRGLVEIGSENLDTSGKLLSGELQVFGRSIGGPIAWLATLGDSGNTSIIYPADDPIPVPRGSRVSGFSGGAGTSRASSELWTGFLEIDLNRSDPGFGVTLQSNAENVFLWTQAAGSAGTRPDRISIPLSARLAGDPYLQWLLGILAAWLAITGLIAQRLPVEPEKRKR